MDKTDKFVTALVGSGVAEIAAEARKLWREVVQSPKTMFTCVAIAMAALVGAGILLTEYFCYCPGCSGEPKPDPEPNHDGQTYGHNVTTIIRAQGNPIGG